MAEQETPNPVSDEYPRTCFCGRFSIWQGVSRIREDDMGFFHTEECCSERRSDV